MTVTYGDRSFLSLLFKWHGSVYKAIWLPYLLFITAYFSLNLSYRLGLDEKQQKTFEDVVIVFDKWTSRVPIQFLLGFYVSSVVSRWWDQLNSVAWPDKFLLLMTGNIQGCDTQTRMIRRTFARYCNLLNVLVWKEISLKVKKRFPTIQHVVDAGLMTPEEFKIFERSSGKYGKWFVPVSWIVNLLAKCKQEGKITDYCHQNLLENVWAFRSGSAMLTIYDWVNIPLVYTQVVTVATYGYFLMCLVGRQTLIMHPGESSEFDLYYPIFTSIEFFFYFGWMKVGEQLKCPFGEDDEDFDMNYVLDRNIYVASMLVDELHDHQLDPCPDSFWNSSDPILPHTKASYKVRDTIPPWRLHMVKIKAKDMKVMEPLDKVTEFDEQKEALLEKPVIEPIDVECVQQPTPHKI